MNSSYVSIAAARFTSVVLGSEAPPSYANTKTPKSLIAISRHWTSRSFSGLDWIPVITSVLVSFQHIDERSRVSEYSV